MFHTRRAGVALVLALTVVTAGCLGALTGSESLQFTASDATVSQSALDEAGYAEYRNESINRTQNVSVAGQTRTVELSNELHGYNRTVSVQSLGEAGLARLLVLSTPAVKVGGQTLNPLSQLSNKQLITRLASEYGNVGQLDEGETRTVNALGSTRNVSKFATTTTTNGVEINTTIHVTTFKHGSDFIVAVALHPERVEGEQQRIDTLLAGIEHDDS